MAPRSRFRTAALIALAIGAAAVVTIAVVFFGGSSIDIERRGRDEAFAEMDRVRAAFAGTPPCVDDSRRAAPRDMPPRATPPPAAVHMLAWEREDERLVRVRTPYWALRAGAFKMTVARHMVPALDHVGLVDLERCGRGLVVDRRSGGGGRVLIWIE
jgi:hypothetical protein